MVDKTTEYKSIVVVLAIFYLLLFPSALSSSESFICPRNTKLQIDYCDEGKIAVIVIKCVRTGDESVVSDSGYKRCKDGEKWYVWPDSENEQMVRAKCVTR